VNTVSQYFSCKACTLRGGQHTVVHDVRRVLTLLNYYNLYRRSGLRVARLCGLTPGSIPGFGPD
jgi:hypothetical protein